MQVFKAFYKILLKKKGPIIMYTAIFLGLAIGMASFGGKSVETSFEEKKYEVAIFDYDETASSKKMIDYLSERTVPVEGLEDDVEELRDHLFIREIAAVIYIKDGFEEAIANGEVENLIEVTTLPGAIYNQTILNYIDSFMGTLHGYMATGMDSEESLAKTCEVVNLEAEVVMTNKEVKAGMSDSYYYMLYLPYVFISCSILAVGSCIMVFNRKEVKDRMNVSSYSLFKKNAGLWGASVIGQFAFTGFFIIVAIVLYGKEILTKTGAFMVLNALCFTLVSLGLTFLIGMLAKKEHVLDMVSNVVGLGFAFLGGIFVPLSVMGDGIKMVSHFIPTYWYVKALEIIEAGKMTSNAGELWMAMGIQLAFALAFTAVGMGITKMRQRES